MKKPHWQGRKVLVTGCTGFLGSHMTKKLVEKGAEVTGLVRDFTPHSNLFYGNNYKVNLVSGALEDISVLERVLGEYEIDTVFHLAAQAIVGIANKNPISTFNANIQGTYNLLEACRRSPGVKNIVVASSDKAYGDQEKLPYVESMPLQGCHPYDVSKSCADLITQCYFNSYKLPVCITRCGNLFGGGDLNFNRIVPHTIKSVLFNEAPEIRSDGSSIRDYIYVEDAVMGYLLLAEKMSEPDLYGEAFNFSNEVKFTVSELVKKILEIMETTLVPVILNQVDNEIKDQYLSAKKARDLLRWEPLFTIEEGLIRTIAWYKDYFKKLKV